MPSSAPSDKPAMQQAGASGEAIDAQSLVPAHLLDGGEIVIFAIKPSMWFIVYVAFRWVAALGMIGARDVIGEADARALRQGSRQ